MTSHLSLTSPVATDTMIPATVTAMVGKRLRAFRVWRRRRQTERTLAGLCDSTLKDIGLHRSEIGAAARRVAGQPWQE